MKLETSMGFWLRYLLTIFTLQNYKTRINILHKSNLLLHRMAFDDTIHVLGNQNNRL